MLIRLVQSLLLATLLIPGIASSAETVPIIGLPCQGCDEVFVGIPDSLSNSAAIAGADEPGVRLRIVGTVRDDQGQPAAGIIVYAYQTDAEGIYPGSNRRGDAGGSRHGQLRAWAQTDEHGGYEFTTIRPASYPNTRIPQHVHMHIIEPGCCTYYIGDILFSDDPLLTQARRERMSSERGGSGLVTPREAESGGLLVTRDIVLGARINGWHGD